MTTTILITSDGMGRGDDELGRRLAVKYLHQLATLSDKPSALAFYNAGVRLLVSSSPALEALRTLEAEGTELIACGTCVQHFGIADDVAVGRVSDMREIAGTMLRSDRVITV